MRIKTEITELSDKLSDKRVQPIRILINKLTESNAIFAKYDKLGANLDVLRRQKKMIILKNCEIFFLLVIELVLVSSSPSSCYWDAASLSNDCNPKCRDWPELMHYIEEQWTKVRILKFSSRKSYH